MDRILFIPFPYRDTGHIQGFEYYCSQVSEMDQFIQSLVFALNRRKEPTVLIMYGDHLPGFSWEAADMKNNSLFQTQYVVWNQSGTSDRTQNRGSLSVSFLCVGNAGYP